MIFSLIILILVGAIAFFHYVQGMFSATISAIVAIIASVLAVSYAEPLVEKFFLTSGFIDYAYAVVVAALFAVIYIVLRLVFDAAVPGNIRLPVLMDKIGAGVMGVVAGIFSTGVFALAAESMPFDLSFGMYSLYPVKSDRGTLPIKVPGKTQAQDATVIDELDVTSLEETDKRSATWIPVADAVLGLTNHLSKGGSLAGGQVLAAVHPDLLRSFYGQRLGQQVGDKRIATSDQVSLVGIFAPPAGAQLNQKSSELKSLGRNLPPQRTAGPGKQFLIVRVRIGNDAAGAGGFFRFSTGAVELIGGSGEGESREWTSYFPIGTLDNGNLLFASNPEDPLFLKPAEGDVVDFVFAVEPDAVLTKPGADGQMKIRDGVFIRIKRLAQLELAERPVSPAVTADPKAKVWRKPEVVNETAK